MKQHKNHESFIFFLAHRQSSVQADIEM